jgi:5-methylcytosine-specific restriction protein A
MSKWPYSTARWQRLRRYKLQQQPLCESCLQFGLIVVATVVDHRTPINAGGEPFPETDKLASLCDQCHNVKSRAEQLGETDWLHKGCDVFGYPLDPRHPWYRKAKS